MKYLPHILLLLSLFIINPQHLFAMEHHDNIEKYETTDFIADFHHYKTGDKAREIYQTEPYIIRAWSIRNLPAPKANSH